ncbi:RHS repeat-associated core domain-containing protein [Streptococcus suis]|uniref:RHS repeat-associated core domain-containing protein n=3 Tax=Streptococcus suis TaxID=1307 RepID=UPI003BA2DE01
MVNPPSEDNLPGEDEVLYRSQVQDVLIPYTTKEDTYNYYETRNYVNDVNQQHTQVLQTYDDQLQKRETYVYGNGRATYTIESTGDSYHYLTSQSGSVTGLTQNGQEVASSSYALYGATKQTTDTTGNPFAYNGEARDVTGLDYLRARYYDSQAGTFLTADTYPGSQTDPLSQNLYAYVQNNPANYTDPSGHIRSPHIMLDDRFGGKVYKNPRPLINPEDGTLYAPSTPEHKAHQIRQQQTGNYSYVYTPKVYSNTPIIKPTSYAQAQAQRDRAREQALAEQRRQQNIRNEYSRATGSKGRAKLREAQNLIKNWGKALEETLKHVCNPQTTKGKDSGTRNKPNISIADFRKIEEANKYGLTVAQKERIDKMTLDQYLQSPQMTAEEILYARQVKFASYTEARKDVFPTFVAELSGWNNIQRLKDGVDPTTGEQANRWFAAGELSLDLASNLLPFLKAGKITQLGKILDATDDIVDTFDYVSDVAKTTDKLDDVEDVGDVAKTLTADDIIFSDKFSKSNYSSQVLDRGWNNQKIADTINNPVKTTSGYNKYTNSSVTNYYIDEIHYVAVDDSTKKVIQISDLNNPNWKGPR